MLSQELKRQALNAYRNGLRATRIAFGPDKMLLVASRKKMKEGMLNPPKDLNIPKPVTVEKQIKHLNDVALFLRRNIVQGVKKDKDTSGKVRYHLNIHKETELGDNESIKKTKRALAAEGGGCCGGGKNLYKQ
ncbi:Mzm1p SCDLUD_002405 [Saccharomycodes ludwigii]|uniref:Mzm1p n=1 Tax=Saccharomycodes ludwigii TaxID=36035 RepID=UPI001E8826C6|nr:hypothetical protein SCDLUD_002405 [Saccharomycodes ludwigii]KAH3900944.1 hypothetical protein SCDLUD_002405 [Saccharomycodes ludwigii]